MPQSEEKKKKRLCFSQELSVKIGLTEAIIINQIHFYCKLNKRNKRNLMNGLYWVYYTYKDWAEDIGGISEFTIARVMKKLKELDLILVGHNPHDPHDRTNWYCLNYGKLSEYTDFYVNKSKVVQDPSEKIEPNSNQVSNKQGPEKDSSNGGPDFTYPKIKNATDQNANMLKEKTFQSSKRAGYIYQSDFIYNNLKEYLTERIDIPQLDHCYGEGTGDKMLSHLLTMYETSMFITGKGENQRKIYQDQLRSAVMKVTFENIIDALDRFHYYTDTNPVRNENKYFQITLYNCINSPAGIGYCQNRA